MSAASDKSKRAPRTTKKGSAGPTADDLLKMYRCMLLMREFDETILRLYQQGRVVGGAYSGRGNEATAVGSAFALRATDYLFPMHRDVGAHFAKGQGIRTMMLQYLGRSDGPTRGRDNTGHYSDPNLRIYGNISHLGAMVPVACGAALASSIRKDGDVALTYIGDGGASVGEVHEGLVMASAMRLPLILIIENNQYAYSTPIRMQSAAKRFADRAVGYGIPGVTVDGTDILAVYRACVTAVGRARRGEGPTIIESVTMRMTGHAAHDTAWYVPKKLLGEWKKKDPIERFERVLRSRNILTPARHTAIVREIREEFERETEYALAQPYPSGDEAARWVYAEE